ncbi:hypothetical protein HF521_013726 [Silurus meridionalis]|uniref:Latent transforming growth factor beta binding protein 3 n=1 Tax=Silurus meridionalis TaxID=175797 RepID=A0A8T0ACC1_SILME|nr:hypothetical protein HF521_013726 [Silurus meridionalis]
MRPVTLPLLLFACLALRRPAACLERVSARERFKVVIAPLICKRTCERNGHCRDTCEHGNNTTLIGENGQAADTLTGHGFRASRGNKQPFYTLQVRPDGAGLSDSSGSAGRQQLTHTHFTLPLPQGTGHHSSEVQFNVRVHHSPDTSVVIQSFDHSEAKLPKGVTRLPPLTQKPRGRCFQETTPKQACSSNPLPGLTNQEDCCGSVGNSWGQNKCYKCPKLPYAGKSQTIIEEFGSTCPQGYKRLNRTHCQDINECMMQGVCQNGECLNTQGSFRCTCKPGYVLKDRTRCVVVDQGPCFLIVSEAGRCEYALSTNISRELCCCTVGKAWGSNCDRCPQDGTASFIKICPAGKGMSYLHFRSTLAIQPDFPLLPHKEIKPPEVPVQVTTPMQLQPISTHVPRVPVLIPRPTTHPIIHIPREKETLAVAQTQVSQVDECKLNRNICGQGECINTHNGFTCQCKAGYRPHTQRKSCVDENECEGEPCGHGRGTCINTVGSYRCNCHPGNQLIGHHVKPRCVDINECSTPDICGIGGHCVNLPGSYKCDCVPGFRSKSRRQPVCEDINECLDPATCPDAQCENTVGSYECIPCQPGHKVHGGVCYDVNECQKRGVCVNGRCENLPGTYRCLCNEGFRPEADGKSCQDFNECQDTHLCANGHCINTEGSFQCQCYPGYQPTQEGSHCEDINECERASNCQRGRCINTMGSYRCDVLATNVTKEECCCSVGVGWGDHYVDECHEESLCTNGHCVNTRGSFYCTCNTPWTPDSTNKKCILPTDLGVNECQDPSNCKNGHCVDTQDSYYCICTSPWILGTDRNSCVTPEEQAVMSVVTLSDVNECLDPSYCRNGRCVNTPGSFHCICAQPLTFSAALKQCVYDDRTAAHKDVCFRDVDEDLICTVPQPRMAVTYSECCCHYGNGWGPECRTCPQRNSVIFNKLCAMNLETESDGDTDFIAPFSYNPERDSSEEDSDECSCANGRCVRSYLGTMCECNPGFRLDHSRTRCVDIDECMERLSGIVRLNPCKNARCVNTIGSFKCICKNGHCVHRHSTRHVYTHKNTK